MTEIKWKLDLFSKTEITKEEKSRILETIADSIKEYKISEGLIEI